MTRKLTDLADVYRDAGLVVFEHTGKDRATGQQIPWQQFGRRRAGVYNVDYLDGGPTHIMEHHTATGPAVSTESLIAYSNQNYQYRPLVNTIFPRDGTVHVLAAGPTNTNGSGHDYWGGGIQDNHMNDWAIGHEIANGGTGEPYPEAQQESVFIATVAECRAYSIPAHHVRSHFEWAPGRKNDPFGPCRWNDGRNTFWDMDALRRDVDQALSTQPPEDDVPKVIYIGKPPAGSGPNEPWLVCADGAVRYATNIDAQQITEHHTLNADQYAWLLKSANL